MQKEYRTKNQNKFVKFRKIVLISTIALVFPICLGIYITGRKGICTYEYAFCNISNTPFLNDI